MVSTMPPLKLLTRQKYEKFLRNFPKGHCSFCDYKKYQIILREWENWIWVVNIAPYWRYHTLLVPKRHFKEFEEITEKEMGEFKIMLNWAVKKYRDKKLFREDGSPIKKYIFFWRLRDDPLDMVSGNIRPDHFHFHIAPDRDHLWDPIVEHNAYLWDVNELLQD